MWKEGKKCSYKLTGHITKKNSPALGTTIMKILYMKSSLTGSALTTPHVKKTR